MSDQYIQSNGAVNPISAPTQMRRPSTAQRDTTNGFLWGAGIGAGVNAIGATGFAYAQKGKHYDKAVADLEPTERTEKFLKGKGGKPAFIGASIAGGALTLGGIVGGVDGIRGGYND